MRYLLTVLFFSFSFIFSCLCIAKPVKLYHKFEDNERPYKLVGTGAIVHNADDDKDYILTSAHLITKRRAREGLDVKQQMYELQKLGVEFRSAKIKCNLQNVANPYVDGAILVPLNVFKFKVLDSRMPVILLGEQEKCLDYSYTFSMSSGMKKDLLQYLGNRSFRKGDSGSVVASGINHKVIGVVYGHGTTEYSGRGYPTSYLFSIDKENKLIGVVRTAPGKVILKRLLPSNCENLPE